MDYWQALILGLVEGLTEYLPVSSTGHLLIVQRLLGIEASEAANAYAIVIQAGAIAAVLGLYRGRIAQMLRGAIGREPVGARIALGLACAFVPAATLGLLAGDAIEAHLFGPWPVAAAWATGGLLLLVISPRIRMAQGAALESLSLRAAWIVGVAQCAALWPGVSRSLATILGGLAAGLSLAAAVEFSFLLGLITLGAATAYKALDSGTVMLDAYGGGKLALGFAAAWISAVIAVKWMVAWLNQRGLAVFGWWRLGAAAAVVLLMEGGSAPQGLSPRRVAGLDPTLVAVLDELSPLTYSEGDLREADVLPYVRSASAVRRINDQLVIIQDDVNALAVRTNAGETRAVLLPPGEGGRRTFDDSRGNKRAKMDLEACARLPDGRLVAFGSGSTKARERLVVLEGRGEPRIVDAQQLYVRLRDQPAFAGSELNVEGAATDGERLMLFQRGNGAPEDGLLPVNAVAELALSAFVAWLDGRAPAPEPRNVVQYDLGTVAGVPFSFTDAASLADGLLAFLACAEASPDTTRDGEVLGCRLGLLRGSTDHVRLAEVRDAQGQPALIKLEGLEPRSGSSNSFDVVADMDRPDAPALLGRLRLQEESPHAE